MSTHVCFHNTRSNGALRRMSLALAFSGCVAVGLIVASARASEAIDDELDTNKTPDDQGDSHTFDVSGMDRTELTRAFAGQLTVLPEQKSTARKEIVFIDPGVPQRDKLVRSFGRRAKVITLNEGRDGLTQIADALAGEQGISAIHIISHGGEARIKLVGASDVSAETLPEHLEQLRAIHNAMVPGGDVLLYGCDIAKGEDGRRFVDLLSKLTGENVAASENRTGAAQLGGDWTLEYQAGTVRTQVLAVDEAEHFDGVLAQLTVTNTSDSGAGSLRAQVNNASSGDTIVFSVPANSTIVLTTAGDTTLGPSALAVTNTLTIDGTGSPGLTICGDTTNATRSLRLFVVTGAGNLTLKNLTLSNGRFHGGNGGSCGDYEGAGGGAAGLGGAICSYNGALTLDGCTLTGNSAIGGDGAPIGVLGAEAGGGGGLNGDGGTGGNRLGGDGGGPNGGVGGYNFTDGGNATGVGGGGGGAGRRGVGGIGGFGGGGGGGGGTYSSAFHASAGGAGGFGGGGGGSASGGGGGGSSAFGGGTGGNNFPYNGGGGGAGLGGAIFCSGGTLNVTNCTLVGNSAIAGTGGNSGVGGQGLGGGIFNRNCNATILNCTIDANTAADGGGGLYNLGDANTASVVLNNTIVANSTSSAASGKDFVGNLINVGFNTTSGVGNIIMSQLGFAGTVVSSADPQVSALASNGGPTQTMALAGTSPAINSASGGLASVADQRGTLRLDAADIGAFEFSLGISPASLADAPGGIAYTQNFTASGGTAPYSFAITSGALPAGLTLSASGELSGTPTVLGIFNFTVEATDSTGAPGPLHGKHASTLNVANVAPAITSGPTATPSTAGVGQTVTFGIAASDADNQALTYTWSIDGATVAGAAPAHVFVAAGTYTVNVTVDDGFGGTATGSVTVTVKAPLVGTGNDSDGDGFSDDFEIASGSSPSNAADSPTGGAAVAPSDLTQSKLSIKLNFAKPANDSISFNGTLPIAAGFSSANKTVIIDVGSVVKSVKLDPKGTSPKGNNSFKLTIKATKGVVAAQTAKYSVKLSKGDFAAALSDEGLTNADASKVTKTVVVGIVFGGVIYQHTQAVIYSAKAGKTGSAKSPK